jgi:hypothetical protein
LFIRTELGFRSSRETSGECGCSVATDGLAVYLVRLMTYLWEEGV